MFRYIGSHKTKVQINNHNFAPDLNVTKVLYHGTIVTEFNNKNIKLNTGGWFTTTTKRRMNQASEEFNLGYYVYQSNFDWFVNYKNKIFSFTGNILNLPRNP